MAFFSALYTLARTMGKGKDAADTLMDKAYEAKKKGDYAQAAALYTKAIEAGRNTWVTYFYRGECRQALGETAAAIADYEMAIAVDRKYSKQAQKALAKLKGDQ